MLESLFSGAGEMSALMRSLDWSQTPLGAIEHWLPSLRTTLSILLSTRHPMVLFWGTELVQFYNDGYRPSLGKHKHPQALGQRAQECWAEIWHIIGPQIHNVMTQGEGTWHEDQLVPFDRNGYFEEIYFTYSYSPVRDETGSVGGTLVVCTETTRQVLSHRRLQTLRQLGANGMQARTVESACQQAMDSLSANPYDIPFALLYRVEADGQSGQLVGTTGIEPGTDASPMQVNVSQNQDWEFAQVCQTGQAVIVTNVVDRFSPIPGGVWDTPSTAACVIPLAQPGQTHPLAGLLVMGISPRREFDDEYRGFFDLVGQSVATAIANARAYETERQRAVDEAARSAALADLNRAKTTFFSNISHEFRTPLTLMLAPTEDALADPTAPLPPVQRERIELIQRNGFRLLKLVNTLLDFSRIEAGRMQAAYEPTDLATLTADLASSFRSLIASAGLELMVECTPLPEAIYVDRAMWEGIVLNLLSNAFKFTWSGTITVQLQRCDHPCGHHVELVIADTGIGIPTEEIPHLFKRFHRVEGSQGRSLEGSGIGLSLVEELVRLHGGSIQVSSKVDRGSCFTVSIPTGFAHLPPAQISRYICPVAPHATATSYVEEARRWLPEEDTGTREHGNTGHSAEDLSPSSSPTARILLCDDNADMRHYIQRLLSPHYQVQMVADGNAALTAIQQDRPDLVLTDVMMPSLDGFTLLRSLRAHPHTQDLPIILLSARAGEEARIEGLAAGADDYVTKPFAARELMARVEGTLKLAQLRQEMTRVLRDREQFLRGITDTVPVLLWSALPDGSTDYLSQPWSDYVGIDLETLNRVGWLTTIHPDDRAESHRRAEHAIQTNEPYEVLQRVRRADGVYRWFMTRAVLVRDANGNSLRWFGSSTDVDDQKRLEQDLRDANQQITTILESMTDAYVALDRDWRITYVNQMTARINQVSPEELVGKSHWDVWPASVGTICEAEYRRAVSEQTPVHFEYFFEPRQCWYEIHAYPAIEGLGIYYRDINEAKRDEVVRKQTEMALQASEEQMRLTFDFTQIGSWDWNISTNQVIWNDNHFRLLGLDQKTAEATYENWRARVHPDDLERVEAAVRFALATHTLFEEEYRILHPDGSLHWVIGKGQGIYGESGQPTRMLGVILDITDRKRAEAKAHQLNQRLHHLVLAIQQLAAARDLTAIVTVVKTTVRQMMAAEGATFILREEDQCYYIDADAIAPLWKGQRFPIDTCISGWSMLNRKPAVITDIYADSRIPIDAYRPTFVKSLVMVPIQVADPIGAIGTYWATHYTPTADEVILLQTLADAVAIAIENVHLYETLEQRVQERTIQLQQSLEFEALLKRITDNVRDSLDEQHILQTAVNELAQGLHLECCNAGIYNADQTTSTIAYEFTRTLAPIQGTTLAIANVFHSEIYQVLFQGHLCQFCSVSPTALSVAQKYLTICACPIRDDQGILGDLWLFKLAQDFFNDQEVRLVQQVANQCAIALRQSRLYQTAQTQVTELEKLNQLKDDFLNTVSHELRSPMANIKMATQMLEIILGLVDRQTSSTDSDVILLSPSQTAKAMQYFQILDKECQREISLINDLLDLARIDAGTNPLTLTDVNLQDWIAHVAESFTERMNQQQQQLHIEIPAHLPSLKTDLPSLERIVTELLHNACKYTPPTETIAISASQHSSLMQISIRNSGVEIPAHERDRIFDKFYRISSHDPWKHGGTGLGLALVKKLVELLQGKIQVTSTNYWVTFTISMPLSLTL